MDICKGCVLLGDESACRAEDCSRRTDSWLFAALEAQLAEAREENARLRAVAEAAEELLIEYDPDEDRGAYQIKAGALTALRRALEGLKEAPHA